MKNFIVYNKAGEILRSGVCADDLLEAQAGQGEFVVEGVCDLERDAFDPIAGVVVQGGRPPEPVDMDYRKARADAYPSIAEQMDMMWHAMNAGLAQKIEPFYSRILAVKLAYPKDNSVVPGSVVVYGGEV